MIYRMVEISEYCRLHIHARMDNVALVLIHDWYQQPNDVRVHPTVQYVRRTTIEEIKLQIFPKRRCYDKYESGVVVNSEVISPKWFLVSTDWSIDSSIRVFTLDCENDKMNKSIIKNQ